MELSSKSARQLFEEVKANPTRKRFGFGTQAALVNVDLQKAYTAVGEFATAYETDPNQIEYVNELARAVPRAAAARWSGPTSPTWTPARTPACGAPAPTRPDSLQNIKLGSRRAEFDDRCDIDRDATSSSTSAWRPPFFETQPAVAASSCTSVDTRGPSPAARPRAASAPRVVDSLSRGYRTIVPEECVADKHESPHFANLYDMALKYADVVAGRTRSSTSWRARVAGQPDATAAEAAGARASTTTCPTYGPAEDRVAERRARRALGRAEHRVLRARPAARTRSARRGRGRCPTCPATRIRDYGNRVGICAHDGAAGQVRHPRQRSRSRRAVRPPPGDHRACAERDWEFFSHGIYNTRYIFGLTEDQERALIQDSIDTIERAHRPEARRLARAGAVPLRAHLDLWPRWACTYIVRPVPRRPADAGQGARRPALRQSIPYSLEMNDTIAYVVNLVEPRRYGEIIKDAVRPPLRRGRRVRHGDVHPAAPLPGRPAAPASRRSRRRSSTSPATRGLGRHRPRDRRVLPRALLRRRRRPTSPPVGGGAR